MSPEGTRVTDTRERKDLERMRATQTERARPRSRPRRRPTCHPQLRYQVRILTGRKVDVTFPIEERAVILGRGPGADLAIGDPALLPSHLSFEPHAEGLYVRTLWPGEFYTWQGRPVASTWTEPGDVIEVGALRIRIEWRSGVGRGDADPAPRTTASMPATDRELAHRRSVPRTAGLETPFEATVRASSLDPVATRPALRRA